MTAVERFEAKYTPEPNSGCWLWTAGTDPKGYGDFWSGTNSIRAHRFAYELYKGPIPDGLVLDHLCRVPCCVNPDHLEAVTHRENILRGIGPSAHNAKKTHCIYGHPFTEDNTSIWNTKLGPARRCKECDRQSARRKYIRRKAKDMKQLREAAQAVVDTLTLDMLEPDQRQAMNRLENVLANTSRRD